MARRLKICVGISLSFGLVSFISYAYNVPLLVAPLAASACILFAIPDAPVARPQNIIFGHAVAAAVGVLSCRFIGSGWLAGPIAITIAVFLMDSLDVMHPPAAATCFLALASGHGFSFVLPVASGACVLVASSIIVKRAFARVFDHA
jgi:CBS-domain-containing membrane protein